jgi:hypothetical protein
MSTPATGSGPTPAVAGSAGARAPGDPGVSVTSAASAVAPGAASAAASAEPITPAFDDTAWDRTRRWRPTGRGLAVAALLLLALAVLMLTTSRRTGYLDPAAVDPSGSRALANVLGDQGVRVTDVRTTADVAANARGATVLVTDSALPTDEMVSDILDAGPSRMVLIDPRPGSPALERLAAGAEVADVAGDDAVEPRCRWEAAQRAGSAQLPGTRYDARGWIPSGHACYDRPESAALVVIPAREGRPEVVLLGSAHPLTNEGFDAQGNAALALSLLGSRSQLVWWRPAATDPALVGQARATIGDLLPTWVVPVLIQVLVACVLVAWWRSRRLGRLVTEPLPVVIRSGETTAGHARLLHAHHARAEAARHLRARARERIRVRLGLPLGVPQARLVGAAAARSGRSAEQVGTLLYGPEPTTDAHMVALGHDLEALMVEVGGA